MRNVGFVRHGFGAPKSTELLHYAFGSVGGSRRKQNPTLIFRADYIEHRFEARAMLTSICDALRNRFIPHPNFLLPAADAPTTADDGKTPQNGKKSLVIYSRQT